MKKNILIISILLYSVLLHAQDNSFAPEYWVVLDSSKGSVMIKQCSREHPENVINYWNVSSEQVKILQRNFKKLLALRIHDGFGNTRIYDLEKYVYQYMGLTIGSNRYIYINASSGFIGGDIERWKHEPYVICDGGPDNWGVLFNLDKLEFSQLAFDGNL